ncbi:heme utilization cystosolic carrier protein HutX [Bosea sp. (in: a-proteobacteria)]|uniref:heme utilization cystosolic carrier protein HutX n=1 Tax=Bosea sp. (in: a-proteobacteria) TaxID=1871050 RepID=UPI00261FDFBF|nr:heme utilization cystosolic carrier protein HutX [Bosea sp. (in: a-proteobacteria)]MCO5091354.1 heme utilization cystosolic carrier protein HutX [Bosea sp. (in: a-proteobacteria)]
MQTLDHDAAVDRVRQALALKPDGILETLAAEHGVPLRTVVECLPADGRKRIDGAHFVAVLEDIAGWGDVTFICHSKDAVVEFSGPVPPGKIGHGMYNLHGASGLGGHLRHENCKAIFFVRRPFMGVDTLSVQFFNAEGEAIFKIYVGRDEQRRLKPEQVERFAELERRFPESPTSH